MLFLKKINKNSKKEEIMYNNPKKEKIEKLKEVDPFQAGYKTCCGIKVPRINNEYKCPICGKTINGTSRGFGSA